MTTQTASLLAIACIALWLASAILRLTQGRVVAGWPLTFLPASMCVSSVLALSQGKAALGRAGFETDLRVLLYCLAALGLSVFSAIQWKLRWLFWTIWVCSGLFCALIVYLVFFWKVFS
jgi:hypothetical protein